jgi:hypothetical protein
MIKKADVIVNESFKCAHDAINKNYKIQRLSA